MVTTGRDRFPAIFAATPWFPSGYQVFVVHITQRHGNAKPDALTNFDARDKAVAHPDLDRTLGNSEVLRHLPFCKQAMLERDRCLRPTNRRSDHSVPVYVLGRPVTSYAEPGRSQASNVVVSEHE